jgi:hypothetical protein
MSKELRKADRIIQMAADSEAEGIEFTEVMSGYIDTEDQVNTGDETSDFSVATDAAKAAGSAASFFLSCHAWDTDECMIYPFQHDQANFSK